MDVKDIIQFLSEQNVEVQVNFEIKDGKDSSGENISPKLREIETLLRSSIEETAKLRDVIEKHGPGLSEEEVEMVSEYIQRQQEAEEDKTTDVAKKDYAYSDFDSEDESFSGETESKMEQVAEDFEEDFKENFDVPEEEQHQEAPEDKETAAEPGDAVDEDQPPTAEDTEKPDLEEDAEVDVEHEELAAEAYEEDGADPETADDEEFEEMFGDEEPSEEQPPEEEPTEEERSEAGADFEELFGDAV